jgi:predicted RND superfamily exporter protein
MESIFGGLTAFVIRFRIMVLLLILIIAVLAISQIKTLKIDTSNEGFLHENDPILTTYNLFRDQFGRDDMTAIAIHSDKIFTVEFLQKLQKLHNELKENVPHLWDITSLVNVRNTHSQGDVLHVDDLLADFPQTDEELTRLKELVMNNQFYRNMLISEDGSMTAIVVESAVYAVKDESDLLSGFDEDLAGSDQTEEPEYLSDEESTKTVEAIKEIARTYDSEDFHIYVAGTQVITQTLKAFMMRDMKRFMKLSVLTIGICLFVMFRRVGGVVLPLVVVGLTVITTLGIMAVSGATFKLPTIILPSFLLAVGVGDSVHVLALTFLNMRHGIAKNQAIVEAFSHAGFALVMTTLTTAAGLASFSMAKVAPIADLGMFCSAGVIIALIYTFAFLPAALSLWPLKVRNSEKSTDGHPQSNKMDRLLTWTAEFSIRRYRFLLILSLAIVVVGIVGLTRVYFSHNVLTWLPKDLDIRLSTEMLDRELRGSVALEMIIDTGTENGLYDRELLLAVERLTKEIESDYETKELFVGKTTSLTTIIKEIHQALHENRPDFYKIPENAKLIPQELLLFENSGADDLEDVVDSQFSKARVSFKVPWLDALLYVPFINDVEQRFRAEFEDNELSRNKDIQVTVTGIMSLFGQIVHATIYSAAQSYGIAIVIVTLLMVLLIGQVRLGFISMLPNLAPIVTVLGIIGWCSIPLNMFTMLVGSIAIGLSVDNTIHFMSNFRKYFAETKNINTAVNKALMTVGRALLTTSVVLSIGFFIFMFSYMNNLFEFGLFTGIIIILALLSNFFMAPALLRLVIGKSEKS